MKFVQGKPRCDILQESMQQQGRIVGVEETGEKVK